MTAHARSAFLATLWLSIGVGCAGPSKEGPPVGPAPAAYLFAWAGDQDERDQNFLAVIDVDTASATYGQVVATALTDAVGGMPHHSELVMPPSGQPIFANAFMSGRSWLFDLANPLAPRAVGEADSVPGYHMPHSFLRVADGSVLATMQFGPDDDPGRPGALARFAPDGRLLGASSSADETFPEARIRTYALDASAAIDRVVTTSSPMDDERTADVVQLWRLSDLALLKTIPVPESESDSAWRYPFEVKFLADGRTAMMNTYYCGFYLLTGLDGDDPQIERVLALEHPKYVECGVPVVRGRFWIMPITAPAEVVVLDLADPRAPTIVTRLTGDSTFTPHWAAPDPGSDRIVLVSHSDDDPRILIAQFDSTTGALRWDDSFRDRETGRLGVPFNRANWPHGATGPALPHGVLFGASRPSMTP